MQKYKTEVKKLLMSRRNASRLEQVKALDRAFDILLFRLQRPKLALTVKHAILSLSDDLEKDLSELLALYEELQDSAGMTLICAELLKVVPYDQVAWVFEVRKRARLLRGSKQNVAPSQEPKTTVSPAETEANTFDIKQFDGTPAACAELADSLVAGEPTDNVAKRRLMPLLALLEKSHLLREECLNVFRDMGYFEPMVMLLTHCMKAAKGEAQRDLRYSLADVYKLGTKDLKGAVMEFEKLIEDDPTDREGWGELLECLADLGERDQLKIRLRQRIELTLGLEREQLQKRLEGFA